MPGISEKTDQTACGGGMGSCDRRSCLVRPGALRVLVLGVTGGSGIAEGGAKPEPMPEAREH